MLEGVQCEGGNISMEKGVQYRSITQPIKRRYIISTNEGVHYGSVTSSVLTRVFSTGLKLLRGGGGGADGCTCLRELYFTDHPTIT